MAGADTLLMLSGGIDSAYCLLQHVRAGLPIRTHHVVLADWEGRQRVEAQATKEILAWMRRNGFAHLITHSESSVNFGTIKWLPKNFYLWAYWAGTIMAAPSNRNITNIIIPRHSDAFRGGPDSPGAQKSDEAYKTTIKLISGREPNLVYPIVHMAKAEVVQAMPRDLLRLCWYCRTPNGGKPCGKCMTCKQVQPAL